VAGPDHAITVEQALRAITIEAAYSIRQEQRVGSIEVGKDANLTILDDSPYEFAPTAIKDIGVWGTMLEGRMQPVPGSSAGAATSSSGSGPRAPAARAVVAAGGDVDSGAFNPACNYRLASSRLGNELGFCANPTALRDALASGILSSCTGSSAAARVDR
jgi:hypothetical protein